MNLEKTSVNKIFLKYAIPSILIVISQRLAEFVDSIFVGRYVGKEGLSAIALYFPLVSILIGIGLMIAIGGSTLSGIELGNKNMKRSNYFFNLTMKTIFFFSITVSVLVALGFDVLIRDIEIEHMTKSYLLTYGKSISYFFVFYTGNIAMAFYVQLSGKPDVVIKSIAVGTILNIVLDYVFVVSLNLSILGAALATGMSQVVIFFILIYYTTKKTEWTFEKSRIVISDLISISYNGLSVLLNRSSVAISSLILNVYILTYYGIEGVASFAIVIQVLGLTSSINTGINDATRVGITYNYGAELYNRVLLFRRLTLTYNIIYGLLMGILIYFFGIHLVQIFTSDTIVIMNSKYILNWYIPVFILLGSNLFIGSYYTSINNAKTSALFTTYRSLLFLPIVMPIFTTIWGENGIWITVICKEVSSFIIGQSLFKVIPFSKNTQINNQLIEVT